MNEKESDVNNDAHNGSGNGNGQKKVTELRKPPKKIKLDLTEESMLQEHRLKTVTRHITHVQQSCTLLGERLIHSGDVELGHKLIANGFIHDNSKFHGIEWMYLHDDIKETNLDLFKAALLNHVHNNPHHPEYWGGIENMPKVYLAEFVCDTHARATEFGTNIRDWIKETATKKFGFVVQGKVYKEVKYFLDLLLETPFR